MSRRLTPLQRKCRYRQAQTRSADEPMTTFVTYVCLVRPIDPLTDFSCRCVNCGNRSVTQVSLFFVQRANCSIQVEVFLIGHPSCILPHFYRLRTSLIPMPEPEFNRVYPFFSHLHGGLRNVETRLVVVRVSYLRVQRASFVLRLFLVFTMSHDPDAEDVKPKLNLIINFEGQRGSLLDLGAPCVLFTNTTPQTSP